MRASARLLLVPATVALVLGGCLLTIPFDDLTKDADKDAAVASDSFDAFETSEVLDVGDADASDVPAHCKNGEVGPGESDTDCGGTCPKCGTGKLCASPSDCLSGNCDTGKCAPCPVGMIRALPGVANYCIDPTEVSIEAYAAFQSVTPATLASMKLLHAACTTKKSFAPLVTTGVDAGDSKMPVRWVDWCDAYSYCAYNGKRLCGAISASKTPALYSKWDDPFMGQWRFGCAPSTTTPVWPYGAVADPNRCTTKDRDSGIPDVSLTPDAPVAVGSKPACLTVTTKDKLSGDLFDMSGNVAEWEDSCVGSLPDDLCRVRGGSFRDIAKSASCAADRALPRSARDETVGFRCCY